MPCFPSFFMAKGLWKWCEIDDFLCVTSTGTTRRFWVVCSVRQWQLLQDFRHFKLCVQLGVYSKVYWPYGSLSFMEFSYNYFEGFILVRWQDWLLLSPRKCAGIVAIAIISLLWKLNKTLLQPTLSLHSGCRNDDDNDMVWTPMGGQVIKEGSRSGYSWFSWWSWRLITWY